MKLPQLVLILLFFLSLFISSPAVQAASYNCFGLNEGCVQKRGSAPAASTSSRVRINPSSVPTENGLGIEGILFKRDVDLSLVRGNGRVGAALSPANSEATFFGPPALELPGSYFNRKERLIKYPSQKVTLATAVVLTQKSGSGIDNRSLKIGIMGKYNKETNAATPGGGISGILGPLSAGYSIYSDQTKLNYADEYGSGYVGIPSEVLRYNVQTYSIGLYLSSLTLDYSNLRMQDPREPEPSIVNIYTASLNYKNFLFTYSQRVEDSPSPAYIPELHLLVEQKIKYDAFAGVQYNVNKNLLVGALYNYYLLDEISATMTLFF